MDEANTAIELRSRLSAARRQGLTIGLVPTMGSLHAGHRSLAESSIRQNDVTVMSIFVNPTQFGPSEDFDRYPRRLEADRQLAVDWGVDILFVPVLETMYPDGPQGQQVWIEPGPLAEHLCGASRPGHFRGVATVVAKLFNLVQPDRAYFGQKDAQQAVIVTRVARDLAFPVAIMIVPTVREPDGLALSSRNLNLRPQERKQAAELAAGLREAATAGEAGERNARRLETMVRDHLARRAPDSRVDYVTMVDRDTLQPTSGLLEKDALLAAAVFLGDTRLIDNVIVRPGPPLPRRE